MIIYFTTFYIEDLVRHARCWDSSPLLIEGMVIDCPMCRRSSLLLQEMLTLVEMESDESSLPSVGWEEHVRMTPGRLRGRDVLEALQNDILRIRWPSVQPPTGWGLCVQEFRRRLHLEPRRVIDIPVHEAFNFFIDYTLIITRNCWRGQVN